MKNVYYLLRNYVLICLILTISTTLGYGQTRGQLLVPQNFPTIQAGINAAGIGDTVVVSPGVYNENINFNGNNKSINSQH